MGKIEKIIKKGPVEGQTTEVYPVTSIKAVYDENNKRLDNIITGLQESVYLKTPIPISTENTTESMAQNVKNIADYVEKAKAAGIADVNGMAVTCIIDDDYSGVGYLYSYNGAPIWVTGIITYDDTASSPTAFLVDNEGLYNERELIIKGVSDQVTSDMLAKGARKPIIFTPETTEVDEETYQKLLSDDVDVVFYTDTAEPNFCTLTYKRNEEDALILFFTCLSLEGDPIEDSYIYAYKVSITKVSPHTCSIINNTSGGFKTFIEDLGYLNKSTLNPVLKEIDLTGTDADRKAKLDQFAVDWKSLTGADTLDGARFVGSVGTLTGDSTMVFTWNDVFTCYTGVGFDDTHNNYMCIVQLNGTIHITPLFSHLEAIALKTSNTAEDKNANKAAIKEYTDNLTALGVDVTKGFNVPVKIGIFYGCLTGNYITGLGCFLSGTIFSVGGENYIKDIYIDLSGRYVELVNIKNDNYLNTTSKNLIGAINEVNNLAKNKQDKLTSGTNIKTINNQSLLGSGNIEISAPSITVDTTISDTSTNPVQNKVIKTYIDGLVGNVAAQLAQI